MQTALDHILLGTSDLDRGIDWVERKTGVRAAFGGVHPGRGTQNALLALGTDRYLEIIAPDPKQASANWFPQILTVDEPRLLTWAAHTSNLNQLAQVAVKAGIEIDGPHEGRRARPDGTVLSWTLFHLRDNHDGLLPFFIEWGQGSIHPSVDSPVGCRLMDFHLESPEAEVVTSICRPLGVAGNVRQAAGSRLIARIATPRGEVELTS